MEAELEICGIGRWTSSLRLERYQLVLSRSFATMSAVATDETDHEAAVYEQIIPL